MTSVLGAPADGYTLGAMGNGQSIASALFTNLPYERAGIPKQQTRVILRSRTQLGFAQVAAITAGLR